MSKLRSIGNKIPNALCSYVLIKQLTAFNGEMNKHSKVK